MIVINRRHVPTDPEALEAYNEAQLAASDYMMNSIVGTKAAFQSTDYENSSLVHDLQWWHSTETFSAHTDKNNRKMIDRLTSWISKYDMSIPFAGHVFGGCTDEVRQMTVEVGQADFMMVPRSAGFIKQTGDGIPGPPVIVYNHRKVLPGKMAALLEAQQKFADYVYQTVPGVIAITAGVDRFDPLLLHDLQIFANMDVFLVHADMGNPETREKLLNWINFDLYDAREPFYGEVWAPEDQVETVKQLTEQIGGARFTVFPIEGVQGSVDTNNWE